MSNNVFFTSDTHFGHTNVIKYSKRPFADVDAMRETLIDNWNAVVRPGDLVYHLGDFAFTTPEEAVRIAKRLAGQKCLVYGNHDKRMRKDRGFAGQWTWCKDIADVKVGDQRIVLCHYAMLTWNQSHRGAWQLHGHSHGSLRPDPRSLRVDVGVDCWNYQPVAFETLKSTMGTKDFRPVDHHGRQGHHDDQGDQGDQGEYVDHGE